MDKIAKTNFLLCILFLCLALSACKDIEHVFLINKTNEPIFVKVTLVTHKGEQVMETDIAPNESDGWEFEANKGDEKILSEKLKSIVIINNKGCKKELQRNDILSLAEKSGAWNIVIDKEVLNCN